MQYILLVGLVEAALLQPAMQAVNFATGHGRVQPRMGAEEAVGSETRFEILDGRVLTPGSSGDGWWDARCAAMPVVLPPPSDGAKWRCFYYGRPAATWNSELPAFLPTGISGLAESDDGLNWSRVKGPLAEGAVLRPSDDPMAFDYVHVGLTDVVPLAGGSFAGLYLGGSAEEVSLGMGPGPIQGFKMRPGAATSRDGVRWERAAEANPLLDVGAPGAWDSNFCSWPRALPLDPAQPDGEWLMTYHALMPPGTDGESEAGDAPRWAVGAAVSASGHALGPYTKLNDGGGGPVLRGGAKGSFDEAGIGTRHVVHDPRGDGGLVMVYEGVGADGRHRLGVATSADGGRSWAKVEGLGPDPGGPIFEGAPPESDAWDNGNVGTPWVMPLPGDGSTAWRLYYVGTSSKGRTVAIGAAESAELLSADWVRVKTSCSGLCVDEMDAQGETSLIIAAERADVAAVQTLLAAGADPAAASLSGWTALHGAAECGSSEVIELLTSAGADVTAQTTSTGKTALDIARQYERPEAAAALVALDAPANVTACVA